jgi:hypothetical protein
LLFVVTGAGGGKWRQRLAAAAGRRAAALAIGSGARPSSYRRGRRGDGLLRRRLGRERDRQLGFHRTGVGGGSGADSWQRLERRERGPGARPAVGNEAPSAAVGDLRAAGGRQSAPSVATADLPEDKDTDLGDQFEEILKGLDCVFYINLSERPVKVNSLSIPPHPPGCCCVSIEPRRGCCDLICPWPEKNLYPGWLVDAPLLDIHSSKAYILATTPFTYSSFNQSNSGHIPLF